MRLRDAAGFFDSTLAKDAYNPLTEFKCQVEPFDYVKIGGTSVKRRVMSTTPDVTVPARGVIDISGQRYLLSDASPDHWAGEIIRNRYVLQGADDLADITSVADLLLNVAGASAYASIEFNKYSTDERDNSRFHPQYNIYFSGTENVHTGDIVSVGSASGTRYYLVRDAHKSMAGPMEALSNELEAPVIDSADFISKVYDPISDSYSGSTTAVRCIRVRWQDHFKYLTQDSTDYERGDIQLLVPTSVTPVAGDTVTLAEGVCRVLSVLPGSGYWSLHVRLT